MFLVDILSWWYSGGLADRTKMFKNRLASSADLFSIGLLTSTIFAPFRQISAGRTSGPIGVQMRALFDRTLSRIIGAIVRIFMILFGLITMFIQIIFGIVVILVWMLAPIFPIVGLIMMVIGWVPTWTI